MTNQHPASGWNPAQQPTPHQGAPVPPSQYGAPQRPQGYPAPQPQGYPAPQPQRSPSDSILVGPFTLRELILFIAVVLVLVSSFLPMIASSFGSGTNLWNPVWPLAIPGALLPVAAAVLVLIRRLAPGVRMRVGSLSVDQFASVTAIVSAATYLGVTFVVLGLGQAVGGGFGFVSVSLSFGPLLGLLFSLVFVAVTTCATFIPPFAADFRGRDVVDAHVTARQAKPIARAPKPAPMPGYQAPMPQPGGYGQAPGPYAAPTGHTSAPEAQAPQSPYAAPSPRFSAPVVGAPADAPQDERTGNPANEQSGTESADGQHGASAVPEPQSVAEPVAPSSDQTDVPAEEPADASASGAESGGHVDDHASGTGSAPVSASGHVNGASSHSASPFWVWSPHPRPVLDEAGGEQLFEIGPDAWALAVEERDDALVIRHDDGRVGILTDIGGLTRG
ncbi:hypothetical protein [Microbacterium sp. MPKO10]|uniref:hypothetical protein n=1 Tax=Microbacterium sp. MPKO10 TaxID=2989818 RepID=UPI0022369982|nr:hypothetical protein [Microbacterium sp. MPKO10]MCW4459415.1 hypothetical protein [Microbacterium sp. MPKO10]